MPHFTSLLALPFILSGVRARGPTPLIGIPLVRAPAAELAQPHYKVREIVIEAEPDRTCPQGFEQSAGNCLQIDSLPVTEQCPLGWHPTDDGLKCMGYHAVAPEHTCDQGSPSYQTCIEEKSSAKILTCPEGFSLRDTYKDCVREISHSPIDICPPGVRYASGSCITVRTEMPNTRCPVDYNLIQGKCQKMIQAPISRVCPIGYHPSQDETKCEQIIQTQPSKRCPAGFEASGGDCVADLHAPPTFVCKKGRMIDGNNCAVDQFAPSQIKCPHGLKIHGISGLCEADDVRPPIPECTKGTLYNPVTNQCGSANKLKQPNLACPPNYHFVGKTACVKHIQEMPLKDCPPGFDLISKDECRRVDIILPEARCPDGSQLRGTLCVAVKTAPFEYICEKGSYLDGKSCLSKAYSEAILQCPPDFTLSQGKVCLSQLEQTPIIACPPNTTQRADANGLLCMVAEETPSEKQCPNNIKLSNGRCVELAIAATSMACPPAHFEDLITGRCFTAASSPQRAFCPVGYKLMGNRCMKQETRPLVPTCPPGYRLTRPAEEPVCIKERTVPMIEICAFGFQLDNGMCIAKKLQYEFDENNAEEMSTPPEEAQLPMESPIPSPQPTLTPTQPEENIEVTVNRPVVQKGLVMRNEPVTLSGRASDVARQQAILASGGRLEDLKDIKIEYLPPAGHSRSASNVGALLAAMAH